MNNLAADIAIGIDVGGTSTKAVVATASGEVLTKVDAPTPKGGAAVVELVRTLVAELGVSAPIGVVVPGIVDETRGLGVLSINLGWVDYPFREELRRALGSPVGFGHDVRAGLVGEAAFGAARGIESAIFVPIGTGIAAASAADGRIIIGGGYAGEIGHVKSSPQRADAPDDEVPCGCGGAECLERAASAASIARRWSAATGRTAQGAKEVMAAARGGDPVADAIVADATARIGVALAGMIGVLGNARIIIGGGFSLAGEDIVAAIAQAAARILPVAPAPVVVPAALGDRAGALGAAEIGRRHAAGKDLAQLRMT